MSMLTSELIEEQTRFSTESRQAKVALVAFLEQLKFSILSATICDSDDTHM